MRRLDRFFQVVIRKLETLATSPFDLFLLKTSENHSPVSLLGAQAFRPKLWVGQKGEGQDQHQFGNQSCTIWAQTVWLARAVSIDENKHPTTKTRFLCYTCNICYECYHVIHQIIFIIIVARCFMSIQVTFILSAIFQ